jgi:hypothetical protein
MLKRASLLAAAMLALSTAAYAACEGQAGNVVFEDTFADDMGGWTIDQDTTFANDELKLRLQDPNTSWVYWNNTFNATEGDFCVEAVLPSSPAADNVAYVGLAFLVADVDNYFLLQVGSDNSVTLWRKAAASWSKVGDYPADNLKLSSGAPLTLRAVVKGGLITPSVNGVDLRGIRAQVPTGALKFGVYIQLDKAVPPPGFDFVIKEYRVTTGA